MGSKTKGKSAKAKRAATATEKPINPDAVFYRIESAFAHARHTAEMYGGGGDEARDVRHFLGSVVEACIKEQATFDLEHRQWFAKRMRDMAATLDPEIANDRVAVPAGLLVPGAVSDLAAARWALYDAADILVEIIKEELIMDCDDAESIAQRRKYQQLMRLRSKEATTRADAMHRWLDEAVNEPAAAEA